MSIKESQSPRDLLERMLDQEPGLKKTEKGYAVEETIAFELLLKGGGGSPAPLAKVGSMELFDGFMRVTCLDSTYTLPYSVIVGLKTASRVEKSKVGAGFLR